MAETIEALKELASQLPEKINQVCKLALEQASEDALSQISKLFKSEGKSLGADWKPLKESTLRQKLRKGYSEKILHRTTTLAQSFTFKLEELVSYIGTPVPYAIYHEYGTSRMPKRPFMTPVAQYLQEKGLKKALERAFKEVF